MRLTEKTRLTRLQVSVSNVGFLTAMRKVNSHNLTFFVGFVVSEVVVVVSLKLELQTFITAVPF